MFVLDDGGEVDLDLGNYERFLDIRLTKDNNLTTGQIYQSVITKERRGDYLGKTVQGVSHEEIIWRSVCLSSVDINGTCELTAWNNSMFHLNQASFFFLPSNLKNILLSEFLC